MKYSGLIESSCAILTASASSFSFTAIESRRQLAVSIESQMTASPEVAEAISSCG